MENIKHFTKEEIELAYAKQDCYEIMNQYIDLLLQLDDDDIQYKENRVRDFNECKTVSEVNNLIKYFERQINKLKSQL